MPVLSSYACDIRNSKIVSAKKRREEKRREFSSINRKCWIYGRNFFLKFFISQLHWILESYFWLEIFTTRLAHWYLSLVPGGPGGIKIKEWWHQYHCLEACSPPHQYPQSLHPVYAFKNYVTRPLLTRSISMQNPIIIDY